VSRLLRDVVIDNMVINILKSLTCSLFFAGYYKPSSELSTAISKSKLNYKFQTLQIATKNFNPTNKIGQGGFGSVYKVISTFILYY
jgi:hypothetical protein